MVEVVMKCVYWWVREYERGVLCEKKIKESKVRGREMASQSVREIFCKDMWWVTNG